MPRVLKHLLVILSLILVAGCASGGCGSGCSSCGVTPIAEGFDANSRIENAAAARVTDSGIQFLTQNIGTLAKTILGGNANGGVLTFAIPSSSGSQFGIDYNVCPDGPDPNVPTCTAEIDVGNAQLAITPQGPHDIHITGPLPVRLKDLPVAIKYFGFIKSTVHATLTGNGSCPGDNETYAQIPLDVDISIEVDTNQMHSRYGYSRVKVNKLDVDQNALQDSLKFCGGFDASILNGLKGIVFPMLVGPLLNTLQTQVDQQLCLKANPNTDPTCPSGTNDVNGVCRYGTQDGDECASILLGTDGHINLGALLASISPGTKGGLDFLLAAGGPSPRDDGSGFAWGDLDPVNNGATLGMYGGASPNPISKCVKLSDIPLPTGIPIPDELMGNTVDGWPADLPGPHVGLALSERFTNYALSSLYNSGLLCIGVTTDTVPLLNSGTFGLLAGSMKDLGLQHESQQIAIVVRPSAPPQVAFGNGTDIATDPLIRVTMKQASFDFYIWSLDRFIRFMTATYDLDVPVNLTVTAQGLQPVLDKIGVNNGTVTNSSLLREDPATLAKALGQLIAGQVGQAVGKGIKPISLDSALASFGMSLVIPDTVDGQGSPGLRKLTKGSDNYLGIFAAFQMAGPMPQAADTGLEAFDERVDPKGLRLTTMTADNGPSVTLKLSSTLDGPNAVEYSYAVDDGPWHPWTRDRLFDVHDDYLRLQGRHVIRARSRVVGQPATMDTTPATAEVVVDVDPPTIAVGKVQDGKVALDVKDLVTRPYAALVRFRLDGGTWSEWKKATEVAMVDVGEAATIEVEAKDEEGNVASTEQDLIRGRAEAAAAGCGCSVPGQGSSTSGPGVALLGVALLGVFARLARRRKQGGARPEAKPLPRRASHARVARHVLGAAAVLVAAGSWAGCSCGSDTNGSSSGGQDACKAPDCQSLTPGLIGSYTSVAVSGKDVWVSGYAEADWDDDYSWGDLVVGKWDGSKVAWEAIDGVPSDPAVDPKKFDVKGFRGGQTEPGDDVGLWTSIAIDGSGNPAVAYYDRTNKALKLAQYDGKTWSTATVQQKPSSDVGKYAKLLFVNGNPVIAYLAMEPGKDGMVVSSVRVATASSPTPGETGWAFEDAVVDAATPCRAGFCSSGTVCVSVTGACTKPLSTCMPECASGSACVDVDGSGAVCQTVFDKSKLDTYPDATGDYVAIAPDGKGGVGIAYYDRVHGNLDIASKSGGKWTSTIVDGEDANGNDTGDMGIGTSLFIDAQGDWHITYVDGLNESLRYVKVVGGKTPGTPSVVDDGLGLDGTPFTDGQHIIGDDSHVTVTSSGEVHVTYQDATAGTLHYAVGSPSASGVTWKVKSISRDGAFGGAFSSPFEVDGQLQLAHWWRVGGESVHGDVDIVSP